MCNRVEANYMFVFTSKQIQYMALAGLKTKLSFPPADRTLPSRGLSIPLSVSSTWCGKATRNTSSSPWSCSSRCSSWPCCSTHCPVLFHRRLSMDESGQAKGEAPLWLVLVALQRLWDHTDVSPLLYFNLWLKKTNQKQMTCIFNPNNIYVIT